MNIPPPNPDIPEGMAFLFSAGGVDPRIGKSLQQDRIPLLLTQAWPAQSKLYWDLGIRYHPELAIKHLRGGGQFGLAEIMEGPPPEPEPELTMEQAAEKILDLVSESNPEFAQTIRNLRASGTDEQKAAALQRLAKEMNSLQTIKDYIEDQ